MQKDNFINSEGDAWFNRNKNDILESGSHEIIINAVESAKIFPEEGDKLSVLEIGCSNGVFLNELNKLHKCNCIGIDPSKKAVEDGKSRYGLDLRVGTADRLLFDDLSFDIIVIGFCLYLCDRSDLFAIGYEIDRCLKKGGYIIISDFLPSSVYKNKYVHREGIYTYKMNYASMFLWNPNYYELFSMIYTHDGFANREIPDERIGVKILQKNEDFAYPHTEW